MSSLLDKVSICNMAMGLISHEEAVDIDAPSTDTEEFLALIYDQVRQELLQSYVWNFAYGLYSMARSGTPAFDYTDIYQLPNNFLRLVSIGGDRFGGYLRDYEIVGNEVWCDNNGGASLKLRYIVDETNVAKFTPLFKGLLAHAIAERSAYKFSVKNSIIDRVNQQYGLLERKAISVDGQERPPRRIQRSRALAARRGSSMGLGDDSRYITFN